MRPHSRFPWALIASTLLLACSENTTDPIEEPDVAEVDDLVASLGTWESFAPPLVDGESATGPDITVDEVVGGTTYACTVVGSPGTELEFAL